MSASATDTSRRALEFVFGEGADRVCRDIPDEACAEQPNNLVINTASLAATKTGDGLIDPKLVMAWLLGALGAPAATVGLLVPVREGLSLLPQLVIGHRVRTLPRRKYVWALACFGQGLAVAGIAAAALTLDGATAGWSIVALIGLFALARAFASVSFKDVLGKTVSKSRRGTVTGNATSLAAAAVLAFGVALWAGLIPLTTTAIGLVIAVAAGLWLIAGTLYLRVVEDAGATEGGVDGVREMFAGVALIWRDRQLGALIATRGLLVVVAIAPPFLVALGASSGRGLGSLGPFVIAASLAAIVGGRVWGRMADRSSRRVLMGASVAGVILFTAAGLLAQLSEDTLARTWVTAALLFLLVLAHQGVRLGRSTHLVDMVGADRRAVYTAVSNTTIGVLLLITGVFGVVADAIGLGPMFLIFAAMCALALLIARSLDEVQRD